MLKQLPYVKPIKQWLNDRYGSEANVIWHQVEETYNSYLNESPDYGGKKNGHANAIYGGLLIFALYPDRFYEEIVRFMREERA